jgi:carbon monoxide dehydrogenase subunit G
MLVMATIRRELRIARPAEQVWSLVGDPGSIHRWFPGIVASRVETTDDGTVRYVTLGSGPELTEEIVTIDPIARRFQYHIAGGIFREHLGTVDVIDLGDGSSLAVYGTDATPDVMALVIGGATGTALENIKALVEADDAAETEEH